MAKLRIKAPDGKTLVIDVGDADKSEYDDLATAAVADYVAKNPVKKPGMIDRLFMPPQPSTVGEAVKDVTGSVHEVGNMTKAGYAGVADLIAGNGLDKSVENIKHVENDEDTTSAAATIGEALGSQFTPGMIAAQAVMGKIGEIIGPKVASLMKGWAEDAAVNAVGKIKAIAKSIGVDNLDDVGRFLLTPIKIGGKEFEPIVSATSSPQEMLDAARKVAAAAGKQLESVSGAVDKAAKAASDDLVISEAGTVAPILDFPALRTSVEKLKEEAVGDLPNLGKPVAKQFNDALADLEEYMRTQATTANVDAFSKLSAIKTKIGNLVYKHGSPLESKAALQDVYHAVSDALENAAKKVGGETAEQYAQANSVYHQAMSVVSALEGKVVDAKKWFDAPAFLAAMSAGFATHGPAAMATVPAAYVGMKAAQNYAPQAIAAGLEAAHPLVAEGIKLTARGIPVVANAISQVLGQ